MAKISRLYLLHCVIYYGIIMVQYIYGDDFMPRIIPIKDLKNTGTISEMCHSINEPIFITKNGYNDMVVMSNQAYDELMEKIKLYQLLAESEKDYEDGNLVDGNTVFAKLKEKYNYDI